MNRTEPNRTASLHQKYLCLYDAEQSVSLSLCCRYDKEARELIRSSYRIICDLIELSYRIASPDHLIGSRAFN